MRVLCNGCWDLLHVGHLWHLEAARKMGDELWVSVTDDLHVNKGPGRPIYNQKQRAALVGALKCVDEVLVVKSLISALHIVRPDILCKGIDYQGGLDYEHETYCKQYGIEIRYTSTPKYSATQVIQSISELRTDK